MSGDAQRASVVFGDRHGIEHRDGADGEQREGGPFGRVDDGARLAAHDLFGEHSTYAGIALFGFVHDQLVDGQERDAPQSEKQSGGKTG